MKTLILQFSFDARRPAKGIIAFILILFGLLGAQDFEGPASGQGVKGQILEVSKLPPAGKSLPQVLHRVHSHAIDEQQLQQLKQKVLPPFHSAARPEVDESVNPVPEMSGVALADSFEGIGFTGWIPPDPVIAVGQNHVIMAVNSSVAIYTKSGTLVTQTTLYNWFSNVNPPAFVFDPKVAYDHYTNRWIILALAKSGGTNPESSYLISVSQSADPTGSWYNFNLDATLNGNQNSSTWADYPGLGFDEEAIYLTSNQYLFGGDFQYAKIRILNKSQLYNNQTPTWTDFWNMQDANGEISTSIKPAHHFGTSSSAYLLNTYWGGSNYLTLWRIDNPLNNPALTRQALITVGSYSIPPDAKQPDINDRIDTGDCRTQDVVYRNGFLYTAFTTGYNWGSSTVSAIRYVKIDVTSNSAVWDVVYGADGVYYYYPAIYVNEIGDIAMVFSRSSTSEYAGVYWTYRLISEGSAHPAAALKPGEGPYARYDYSGRNRWGDYSGIGLDPMNSQKIWFYGEWAGNDSTWGTWAGSFVFPIPITFTNKIGTENAGGTLLVNNTDSVNSGESKRFPFSSQNTVRTLNERFLNWQNGTADYKHHDWNQVDPEYLLNHDFTANPGPDQFQDANFRQMHPVQVKNKLLSAAGAEGGLIDFHDPWFLESDGSQPDGFLTFDSPYHPTGARNETEGGVFLNQNPQFQQGKPIYSVRAVDGQQLSVNGKSSTWDWESWSYDPAEIDLQNPDSKQTAVVFKQDGATLTANLKGRRVSDTPQATAGSNAFHVVA